MKSIIYIVFLGLVALFIASFISAPNEPTIKVVQDDNVATSTVKLIDEDEKVDLNLITIEPEINNQISVVEEEIEKVTETPDEVIVEQIVTVQAEKIEEIPQVSFSQINEVTRATLVNIFCTTKSGGSFRPITGSGIIIDDRGVVLTNAHVAQYFLLEDYLTEDFINCVVRTGSPAKPLYKAKLIFISPSWVQNNANNITQSSPKGTGEDDYALLLITERTDPSKSLPQSFHSIEMLYNSGNIKINDDVLLAAYPAGFLSGIAIAKDLYISSAITEVMEVFTFKEGTLDLFSIGGSVVAQQGSSGGAVIDTNSKLLGIIVTSSVADTTAERDLRAITIAHINRSFTKDTGSSLQTLFDSDLEQEISAFNTNIAPDLKQLLVDELEK